MTTTTHSQTIQDYKDLPDWLIAELITDSYCLADYCGDETEKGKDYIFKAEELAAELDRRAEL